VGLRRAEVGEPRQGLAHRRVRIEGPCLLARAAVSQLGQIRLVPALLLDDHRGKQGREESPEQRKKHVHRRLKRFAAPQIGRISEKLENQPDAPEQAQTRADPTSQGAVDEIGRAGRAEQAHQEHGEPDEEGVDIQDLPGEQGEGRCFLAPAEVAGEHRVQQAQPHEKEAGGLNQAFHLRAAQRR
jgi:hypothetical protein